MLETDRIYLMQNHINGQQSWFFKAREGDFGPYETKRQAESMLQQFVKNCLNSSNAGGRSSQMSNTLARQMQGSLMTNNT